MRGSIYVIYNFYMPELVKIGMTTRSIKHRLKELHNTSSPCEWECWNKIEIDNVELIEKKIHSKLRKHRVSINREFFKMDPYDAWEEVKNVCGV